MQLASSQAVQSDWGALGEGGGAEPGRHGPVGGNLVGGDWGPGQGLGGGGRQCEKVFTVIQNKTE